MCRTTACIGLPPSPPSSSGINIIDGGPYSGVDNNGRTNKPLGVDVRNRQHKDGLGGGIIAVIVLSAFVAVVLCSAAALVLLFKYRKHVSDLASTPRALPSSLKEPSGNPNFNTMRSRCGLSHYLAN